MIKKYNGVRLKKIEVDNGECYGCFFRSKEGSCNRKPGHFGEFSCAEEHDGEWVEDEQYDDGGYYETIEKYYLWKTQAVVNKSTVTL